MPKTMMAYLSTQKGMYFNHKYGVDKDAFIGKYFDVINF
jgi:hypothetical protein